MSLVIGCLYRSTLPKFESAKMFCQKLTRCACADIFIMVSCSGDSKMKILLKASHMYGKMFCTLEMQGNLTISLSQA